MTALPRGLAALALLLACAPVRATASPIASAEAPAAVRTAPAVAIAETDPAPVPIDGETDIDLGMGDALHLLANGELSLGDTVLVPGSDYFVPREAQVFADRDRATLVLGLGTAPDPYTTLFEVVHIDLQTPRVLWQVAFGTQPDFDHKTVQWRALVAGDRVLMVEDHRVLAIDSRTGTQAWVFRTITDRFFSSYFGPDTADLMLALQTLQIDRAVIRDRALVLAARTGSEGTPTTIELDVDTGRRLHVMAPRKPETPIRLSEFTYSVPTHVAYYDDPPPPEVIPLRVEGYDGVAVGYAVLLWNQRTAKGVIVNPRHDQLGEVLAQARAARTRDAKGNEVEITWTAVIDTAAIADSVVGSKPKPGLVRGHGAARFDYSVGLDHAGEFVDADAVARALKTTSIDARSELTREFQLRLEREPDAYTAIRLSWGPFDFSDDSRPADGSYLSLR